MFKGEPLSLRVKFLGLLVVIPSICLGLFLYFAFSTFVNDKTNYLFESQFQLLNSASLLFLDSNSGNVNASAHSQPQTAPQEQAPNEASKNLQAATEPINSSHLTEDTFQIKVAGLLKQEGFENLLILSDKGVVLDSRKTDENNKSLKDVLGANVFDKLMGQSSSEGSFEAKDKDGEDRLISFLRIPIQNESRIFVLHSLKSGAIRASLIFLLKSISAFVALLALSALISIIFSNKLTLGIRTLSKAMREFGEGKDDSPLPQDSEDEVGQMSGQFKQMRIQIGHLLVEKENKTKIETEMKLAGDLQKRFFPKDQYQHDKIELTGYFEPAHDAGGDWWFYFEKDQKLIFLIGDVTGHGLNSAMITGVSRSAFSLIEDHFVSPAESLRLMNRAIFDASNGELNMTCFVGCLDLETGKITYANASHEPPYVLPPVEKSLKLKDMENLAEATGPRLGEKKDSTYPEHTFQLEPDSLVFLYSDGLTELKNSSDDNLGERKLVLGLGASHTPKVTTQNLIQKVKTVVATHRQNRDLNDDLSYMAIKWRSL